MKRFYRLAEGEHLVHDWVDVIGFDGPVHLLEHGPVTNEDTVQTATLQHHGVRIGIALEARQYTNHGHLAGMGQRQHRLLQCACAADLDYTVGTAAVG